MITFFMQMELVNFGVYSCDWIKMNSKFKKSLLLTTRMNDACSKLMLKASPKNIINLQLFASVRIH